MWGWLIVVLLAWGLFPAFTLLAAVLGVDVAGGMSAFEDASTLIEYEKRLKALEDLFGV